jgi:hypothetical protein
MREPVYLDLNATTPLHPTVSLENRQLEKEWPNAVNAGSKPLDQILDAIARGRRDLFTRERR